MKQGVKHTDEWKKNMSEIMKKKWSGGEIIRDFGREGHDLFLIDGRNINNSDLYDAIPWVVE